MIWIPKVPVRVMANLRKCVRRRSATARRKLPELGQENVIIHLLVQTKSSEIQDNTHILRGHRQLSPRIVDT